MANAERSRAYKEVREALVADLTRRGLTGKAYLDKVEEYMDFWVRRRQLRDDVAARGLTVEDERGRISENRSVSLEIQVSRQMLALFTALGFKADLLTAVGGADDDDL